MEGLTESRKPARTRTLHAAIMLICGSLVSSAALGLVLGDITLSSSLDEPLAASIEIDSLAGAEASEITVTVGDQAAYEAAGVDRDPILDNISFAVEVDNENEGRIVLTSTDRVAEPFLNLIVSVADPGGETRKEYTLLLEFPAEGAVTQTPATPPAAIPAATAPAVTAGGESYTVGAGDTMWEIALATRPDSSVSVQQMMVAIQRANPDAFIDNNINRLINGRVLRIPAPQDIGAVDQQAAVTQVAQQADPGGQPLAPGNTGAGGAAAETRDQLRVLSGDDVGVASGGSSDLAATIAALENQLMLSEESLDRARIENLELNNRLASLQEQIDLLENIIAIEDERIAGLQAELTQQAAATEQALASADTAVAALGDINAGEASGLTGWLRNSVVAIGGLLVLALAVAGGLVYRRRQLQAAAEDSRFNPALADEDDVAGADDKPGLLAGLLARFRSKTDADDYSDEEADAIISAQSAPAAGMTPRGAASAKKDSTDNLLDEMGINEDLMNLDDALDGIDESHAEEQVAEVFSPVDDDAEAVSAEQTETPEQRQDSDYALTAAAAAFAAIDKDAETETATEFSTTEASSPVDVPGEPVEEDAGETFEFKLKDLPEIESAAPVAVAPDGIEGVDFKLGKPVVAAPPERTVAAPDAMEVIAFPGAAAKKDAPPAPEEDISLELGDLSFDDTTLPDENEDESPYKPRAGNECDTKLDLATAYEAMGDVVEAIEILDEVIAEGSPAQVETAQRLKETWQASL